MNSIVLDASAILAIIQAEPGHERFTTDMLSRAVASTVNVAEVHGKLVSRGWTQQEAWEDARSPIRKSIDFDEEQAKSVGDLVMLTQKQGLSLGDRACLALGLKLKAPVYTAEKRWKELKLSLKVHLIR